MAWQGLAGMAALGVRPTSVRVTEAHSSGQLLRMPRPRRVRQRAGREHWPGPCQVAQAQEVAWSPGQETHKSKEGVGCRQEPPCRHQASSGCRARPKGHKAQGV